ncbi:MAG: histidine phosphatase family protein [bacterium]
MEKYILYLLRHGESKANADRIFAARKIDPPLTERGIKQAIIQAEALKEMEFSAIYASPLLRAQHTANIINNYHKLDIKTVDYLYEVDVGDLDTEDQNDPEKWSIYNDVINKWDQNLKNVAFPNGEALNDVERRLDAFIKNLETKDSKPVLVVGHCLLFMAFFWLFCKNRNERIHDNCMGRCHFSIVSKDKDGFNILKYNVSPE